MLQEAYVVIDVDMKGSWGILDTKRVSGLREHGEYGEQKNIADNSWEHALKWAGDHLA